MLNLFSRIIEILLKGVILMDKHVLKITLVFLLIFGSLAMKQEEMDMVKFVTILKSSRTGDEKKRAISGQFLQLKKEGKLTPAFFAKLIQKHGGYSTLHYALHEADIQLAKEIYTDLLLSDPPLTDDLKYKFAFHLGRITNECESDKLFKIMKSEEDLDIAILIAHAFIKSRKTELQEIAILWANVLRKREFSQANHETERSLHTLLFEIGTPEALAEILKNLERGGGTTAYLIEGIRYLGDAEYKPGYEFCKRMAENEEMDNPERMEALQSMFKMYPSKKQEILEIAEKIQTTKSFYSPFDEILDELIVRLKSH